MSAEPQRMLDSLGDDTLDSMSMMAALRRIGLRRVAILIDADPDTIPDGEPAGGVVAQGFESTDDLRAFLRSFGQAPIPAPSRRSVPRNMQPARPQGRRRR